MYYHNIFIMTGIILQLVTDNKILHDTYIEDLKITMYECVYKKKLKFMVEEIPFQIDKIKFEKSNCNTQHFTNSQTHLCYV
ncbi:putative ORFan [Tupanvirus deep ocean]|uniref:ORFan n=2 Tax=Tupanvirus TaxID=2094720 RepID=A0AC62A8R1_9VIRU|nr:putative ORFan [Tupanvirus deep ocean]QKU34114.1 putative ORFan [Tupanvirus deep ocean]